MANVPATSPANPANISTLARTPAPANPSQIPADVRIPSLASGTCGRIHPAILGPPFSRLASPAADDVEVDTVRKDSAALSRYLLAQI
jgi:hypothetical protein